MSKSFLSMAERGQRALDRRSHISALAAALQATVIHHHDRARDWLERAADLAGCVPDTPARNWGAFSRSNVAVWTVSLGVERGESGGTMLELARGVDEDVIAIRRGRHATFLADMGRGLARDPRTRSQAERWLLRAERAAPHKIRNSGQVAETVAVMIQQNKSAAMGRELRGLAARMRIPH
ncbi:hypothetical protein [Actinomadura formosensis]|uniref:hypothetical protein n=1 Tax=Actinomadura formosensis TaxID=60706 RepID=UPI003D8FCC82